MNRSLNTPAMELVEPLGLVASPTCPVGVAIAERDPAVRLDSLDRLVVGDEIALAVGDGELDHLPGRIAARERGLRVLDPQVLHLADEAALGVAHQHARQQAGFAQDLEAVADAEHQPAARGVVADRLHDRGARGDRAAAQIVAVGEAARQDDEIRPRRQLALGVPDDRRRSPRSPA